MAEVGGEMGGRPVRLVIRGQTERKGEGRVTGQKGMDENGGVAEDREVEEGLSQHVWGRDFGACEGGDEVTRLGREVRGWGEGWRALGREVRGSGEGWRAMGREALV